ncbi:LytTR family transcriptional regulator [Flagellimonas alvinocaridis]|uniref:LytTR family transcriptional regulator n=1 Tax=Flagellimonas alvinocaridis TaxID=2530200 RepID=A0A4S8RQZ1_9FLAO|nr:LytTR family DNA-binding domain-containing protein [Allomuricauda alvinocaridis]THV61117.1 LytTR family transcriptional regulator [Allomuricauda alvinocaridis]
MVRPISLISIFVLLNMGIGRMFQVSLGATCFSELTILAVTSFVFWTFSAQHIKVWAQNWEQKPFGKTLALQGGLSITATAMNILIGQVLVVFMMTVVFRCASPNFNLLHAGLTNNIAVNLFCYFALLFYFVNKEHNQKIETPIAPIPGAKIQIEVSRNGSHFLLIPEEIIYIETSNNCIVLHTERGVFVKYQSLRSVEKIIGSNTFKRVHRSYLVNMNFMDFHQKNSNGDGVLHLKNGDKIKFSRTYRKNLVEV